MENVTTIKPDPNKKPECKHLSVWQWRDHWFCNDCYYRELGMHPKNVKK